MGRRENELDWSCGQHRKQAGLNYHSTPGFSVSPTSVYKKANFSEHASNNLHLFERRMTAKVSNRQVTASKVESATGWTSQLIFLPGLFPHGAFWGFFVPAALFKLVLNRNSKLLDNEDKQFHVCSKHSCQ